MDEIVLRAMAKWPDVPAVYGWLALDRRGQWLLKGERIANPVITEFIGRNYGADPQGRWFFQNGPQRVYVSLAYTPVVLRLADTGVLTTHCARPVFRLEAGWIDENGVVLLDTEHGPTAVDDRDIEALSACFADPTGRSLDDDALLASIERLQAGQASGLTLHYQQQHLVLQPINSEEVPARLGFVTDPQPAAGENACR
jgi:hypothetical protein